MVKLEYNSTRVLIGNIYAPNNDCPEFFDNVFDLIERMDCENIILAGDFNLAFDIEKDKKGIQYNNVQALATLIKRMTEYTLSDIWRFNNPEKFSFTWKRHTPRAYTRLDYILVPSGLIGLVNQINILPGFKNEITYNFQW